MQADKQTGTGGNRPALGPGKVTHWVVATVHVSGLGPALSGGSGRPGAVSPEFQAPALGGEEWRGLGEKDQDGSWGERGGLDLGEGLISSHPSGCGGQDPVEGKIRSWAGPGKGQES